MTAPDPALAALREQVTAKDRAILDLVNERLEIVLRIRRHKAEHGLPLVDLGREDALVASLQRANRGPLSDEGVDRLFRHLLGLLKEETGA